MPAVRQVREPNAPRRRTKTLNHSWKSVDAMSGRHAFARQNDQKNRLTSLLMNR